MECNHILVRFGELTTKGKNRKMFIRKLCQNTKEILKNNHSDKLLLSGLTSLTPFHSRILSLTVYFLM